MKNKFDLILNISVFVLGVVFIVLWSNGKGVFDLVSMAVGILFIVFSAWSLVAFACQEKGWSVADKSCCVDICAGRRQFGIGNCNGCGKQFLCGDIFIFVCHDADCRCDL